MSRHPPSLHDALTISQDGDDDQAGDADQGEQEGDGIGLRLLEVLVLRLDREGRGLGAAGDVAGDDLHGAELADRPGQREDHAVPDRSEEHMSELKSLMSTSSAVFLLNKTRN